MTPHELKARTKGFALAVIRFCRTLPAGDESRVIRRQLLRSGTSVGAHYRAVCRGRSDAEFIAKLGLCIEECDESGYWLELLVGAQIAAAARTAELLTEADELTRIFVASREPVRARIKNQKSRIKN